MDRDIAAPLVKEALAHAYDEGAFKTLLSNLLGDDALTNDPVQAGSYVYAPFREHVRRFQRLAKYEGPDGEEMDVLAVELANDTNLDRARTRQRNFVAAYLERKTRDAALVVFTTPDRGDWRLSFVHLEYRSELAEDETVKTEKVLTPARRYSFLVGEGEPSHTARKRVLGLLTKGGHPTVEQIEEAFSVERVEKEFYDEYKEHYLTLKEDLDDLLVQRPEVRREFERCHLTTEGFAKKLLGQIVFLYFVQKKGWLGVAPGEAWGSGPKDFLRKLYAGDYGAYDNFFDDKLEPLFYEALATERGAGGYFDQFGCRIPFLNGGLFEPPGGYDWAGVPLQLKDETFGSILSTFDTYNFTVREDEPLEKEVAVDPEMLGKVFENLLEVKDRKAKGAFYTPREIVAYMCNESLIAYLDGRLNGDGNGGRRTARAALAREETPQNDMFTGTPPVQSTLAEETVAPLVPHEALAALVREGERWAENDRRVIENGGQETGTYKWASPETIRRHAAALDTALADAKVCDPAIGSGAFPVGMMQAVVRVREVLTPYLTDGNGAADARTAYAFKRHAIQHSLYGVDIEPSAVDIARLRLWLSLIVDEEDFSHIDPLPNLRYKIVEGDALGGVEHNLENNAAYDRLQSLIPQHVGESSPVRKDALQEEIDALIETVAGDTFDFSVYFGDVLQERRGFDVVLANPPYVQQESLTQDAKAKYKKKFEVYHGMADLYVYFLEQGVRLLRPGGTISYITSNSYLNADFAEKLRGYLSSRIELLRLIDFAETPVFDADTEPVVLVAVRRLPAARTHVASLKWDEEEPLGSLRTIDDSEFVDRLQSDLGDAYWQLERPEVMDLLAKLRSAPTTLGDVVGKEIYYGIKTGRNAAFMIKAADRARMVAEDPKSDDLLFPYLRGRDIRNYRPAPFSQYMIRVPKGWTDQQTSEPDKWAWFQRTYPAITRHLAPHEKKAKQRYDKGVYWWELRSCTYYDKFAEPKIIYQEINRTDAYAYDEQGLYLNNKAFMLPGAPLYLLGLLKSSVGTFFIHVYSGVPMGGFLALQSPIIKAVPVPGMSDSEREDLEQRLRQLLALHEGTAAEVKSRRSEIARLEAEVDRLVYNLYGLTDDEIALVEARVGKGAV